MDAHILGRRLDLSRYRLTRFRVVAICALLLSVAGVVSFDQYSNAEELVLPSGGVIGGDYIAFQGAARAAADADADAAYDRSAFEARIRSFAPPRDHYGLTWQYPPTFFLIVLPLSLFGLVPGYILWTGGTAAAYFATLRANGFSALFLFVILASPSIFHAVITGQNGFLTAALLAIAALMPDKRPVVAGLAAALLTIKPHLGLLLPVAYIAGGYWRAFFSAAFGAAALAAASIAAFGPEVWTAFLAAIAGASDNVANGSMPLYKMATPYAAIRLAGAPAEFALATQITCTLVVTAGIALIWRRVRDADLRAAALCAGVFLASPYGYYYEFTILAIPVAILARRSIEKGWLPFEEICLALAFITPLLLPGEPRRAGLNIAFLVVVLVAGCVVRRIAHDHPYGIRFSSVGFHRPAG